MPWLSSSRSSLPSSSPQPSWSPPASFSSAKDKRESPLATFRSGWAGRKNPDADQRAAAASAAVEPVDLSLAQFLRETVDEGEAYLQVDDLAATLQRAKDKATGVLPGHRDR